MLRDDAESRDRFLCDCSASDLSSDEGVGKEVQDLAPAGQQRQDTCPRVHCPYRIAGGPVWGADTHAAGLSQPCTRACDAPRLVIRCTDGGCFHQARGASGEEALLENVYRRFRRVRLDAILCCTRWVPGWHGVDSAPRWPKWASITSLSSAFLRSKGQGHVSVPHSTCAPAAF